MDLYIPYTGKYGNLAIKNIGIAKIEIRQHLHAVVVHAKFKTPTRSQIFDHQYFWVKCRSTVCNEFRGGSVGDLAGTPAAVAVFRGFTFERISFHIMARLQQTT